MQSKRDTVSNIREEASMTLLFRKVLRMHRKCQYKTHHNIHIIEQYASPQREINAFFFPISENSNIMEVVFVNVMVVNLICLNVLKFN